MDELDLGATIKGFLPGQRLFNRYTLVRQLGRGGMGIVWAARDEELNSEIALKFLPEVIATDRAAIEDMKREVRRAIDLAHPHIVKIQHFLTDGRMAAVAMEYVQGDTLSSLRVDQPGQVFTPGTLAPWVVQLCSALDYAHAKARVAHRDLKPANLMVDTAGDLKILDFGIAASLSESVTRVSKQAGSSGTPVYMSPQQMMGEKPAITDDIYALGATLYELLTGKPPFYAGNIILQVQNKAALSLAERREELGVTGEPIPPAWEQTVADCLAKEPKDRPQSAGEVAERLGLGGLATRNTSRTKSEKVERGVPMRSEPVQRPSSTFTSKTPHYVGLAAVVLALGGLGWYFGVHAPEQKRLAEIARLEAESRAAEQARLAETLRQNEQKRMAAEAAERRRQEAEAARLAAARGGLVVRTEPSGAEVRVGAVALDKSPLSLKDLKLGKYPVRIRLNGYEDHDSEIEVKENEFADTGIIRLVRSTGFLSLTSTPEGVDFQIIPAEAEGKSEQVLTGRTPAQSVRIPTGKYRVIFERSRWGQRIHNVTIERGGTGTILADMRGGSIQVLSDPPGATVKLQERVVGRTPVELPDMPWQAPTQVTAELPLHAAVTREASPQPGQPVTLQLVLPRLRTQLKLMGLPPGARGLLQVRWSGREFAVGSDDVIELPAEGGSGRLKVGYGPVNWETDLSINAGETRSIEPDLVPRFNLSRAPTVIRTKTTSAVNSSAFSMRSSEELEISWRNREGNRWMECDVRVLGTTTSSKLVGNDLYHPGTTFRFQRRGPAWDVQTVQGGLKSMPNFRPPIPNATTALLTEDLLPSRPVQIGEQWELPPMGVATLAAGLLRFSAGSARAQIQGVYEENSKRVTVIVYQFELQGQAIYLSASQSIKGSFEVRAVLDEGWVKHAVLRIETRTDGVGVATSTVEGIEEPVR